MSNRSQQFIDAARQVAGGADVRDVVGQSLQQAVGGNQGGGPDNGFDLNERDFPAARAEGSAAGTRINSENVSLDDAAEKLSRSHFEMGSNGPVHVITPMVMPKGRKIRAMLPVILLIIVGAVGSVVLLPFDGMTSALFGPHYWILIVLLAAFMWWRQGMVMVPEGCTALISRFGKVEAEVGPGRVTLWNPWKRVSYIVNTTREYPFNAPIRQAPTKSGVQASVDLFLQFRIVNAREFVFVLGAVSGFQDKLNNAISETTRSLIYDQEASGIYDLVGESTARLLEQLNVQFAPAVELTTANITHAEPSAQEYRMDLAAPEMIRVAKEAYTYDYELNLRKEQNEGDLNKDLASLNENLSAIQADIARYQAQMDTALERETNRANAMARQRFVESESTAHANAAMLEAQALDIRALSAALAPEILDYRYQQDLLDKMESLAQSLPQIVRVGGDAEGVDYLHIARELVGGAEHKLFSDEDMADIQSRKGDIAERVSGRKGEIEHLLQAPEATEVEILPATEPVDDPEGEQVLDQIRRSVTDEAVTAQLEEVTESGEVPGADEPAQPGSGMPTRTQPGTPQGPGGSGQEQQGRHQQQDPAQGQRQQPGQHHQQGRGPSAPGQFPQGPPPGQHQFPGAPQGRPQGQVPPPPGQAPQGQFPPGQFPPGQFPPGQGAPRPQNPAPRTNDAQNNDVKNEGEDRG
ncbi:SPFH domain-containing protein [Ornithinimicrobium faecis]|uniref:SPFH domain-containing protein n=1 Tax=Ornithinimicrobium faecis TaxID=2934158 RepID=UPI0021189728|nr:SPFH domain-containing protein [Ornithinimicrobium sp. HY1745]